METYRSGHNGADSKLRYLFSEAISQVRINTEFFALHCAFSKIPVLQFSCIVFQRVFFLKFHMEMYRRGHNENDSKHSRVCHTPIFETPLFIGVYATCNCTFRILHLAVFSQFRYQALPLQFYMETYRSGHNGADSKHSRVYHDCIFVNPLFIGVYAMCICTLTKLHLAVFSQFGN